MTAIDPDFNIYALAFHQDTGNLVVQGDSILMPGELIFNHYDPQTGSLVSETAVVSPLGASNPIQVFLMSEDGNHLLRSPFMGAGMVEIYETNGTLVFTGMIPGGSLMIAGGYIVSGNSEPHQVYEINGSLVGTLQKPDEWVYGSAFLPQSAEVVYLFEGASRKLYIYSLPDLELVESMPIWGNNVRSFSPDLTRSMNLVGWEINNASASGEIVAKIDLDITPQAIALKPDKTQLVKVGSFYDLDHYGELLISVWDLKTLEVEKIITFTENFDSLQIFSMQFLPDGKTLIMKPALGREFIFYDLEKEEIVDRLPVNNTIFFWEISPDGNTLAVTYRELVVAEIWDLNTKEMVAQQIILGKDPSIIGFDFSLNSRSVAVFGNNGMLWDLDSLEEPTFFETSSMGLSPDEKTAVTILDGSLYFINVNMNPYEVLAMYSQWLNPGEGYNTQTQFTVDGRMVIMATSDAIVFVDVSTGEVVHRLDHQYLNDMQMSPDGSLLMTYSTLDAVIRLWGVP